MSALDECPVCSNPDAATWLERYQHGCSKPHEVLLCAWCGTPHLNNGVETPVSVATWCAGCQDKHRAANPDAEFWKGWEPIGDVLPGGRLDGALEEIGLTTSPATGLLQSTSMCEKCGQPYLSIPRMGIGLICSENKS